jgi:hypothetical protein
MVMGVELLEIANGFQNCSVAMYTAGGFATILKWDEESVRGKVHRENQYTSLVFKHTD